MLCCTLIIYTCVYRYAYLCSLYGFILAIIKLNQVKLGSDQVRFPSAFILACTHGDVTEDWKCM